MRTGDGADPRCPSQEASDSGHPPYYRLTRQCHSRPPRQPSGAVASNHTAKPINGSLTTISCTRQTVNRSTGRKRQGIWQTLIALRDRFAQLRSITGGRNGGLTTVSASDTKIEHFLPRAWVIPLRSDKIACCEWLADGRASQLATPLARGEEENRAGLR